MSKFGCTCGNVISDVVCPNEVTGGILSDKSDEKFFDKMTSVLSEFFAHYDSNRLDEWKQRFDPVYPQDLPPSEMLHDLLHSRYVDLKLDVLECDQCYRLWIQEEVDVNRYRAYTPDDGGGESRKVLGFNESKNREEQ